MPKLEKLALFKLSRPDSPEMSIKSKSANNPIVFPIFERLERAFRLIT